LGDRCGRARDFGLGLEENVNEKWKPWLIVLGLILLCYVFKCLGAYENERKHKMTQKVEVYHGAKEETDEEAAASED
jgi:hypothetical protein